MQRFGGLGIACWVAQGYLCGSFLNHLRLLMPLSKVVFVRALSLYKWIDNEAR